MPASFAHHNHLRRALVAALAWLATALAAPVHAQDDPAALEARLAGAAGAKRLAGLEELANAWLQTSPEDTLRVADGALELAARLGDDAARARLLKTAGVAHTYLGDYEAAAAATAECIEVARAQGLQALLGIALINQSAVLRYQGRYQESLGHATDALEVFEAEGSAARVAVAQNAIGVTHYYLGEYEAALESYFEALRLREELGDTADVADSLNNIAVIYDEMKQVDKALEFYERSLELFEAAGDLRGLVNPLNNLGTIYYTHFRDYARAEAFHRRALEIRREIQDRSGEAASLNNLGNVLRAEGDPDGALQSYLEALAIRRDLGDDAQTTVTLRDIGDLYRERGQLVEARAHIEEALALAEGLGATRELKTAHFDLAEILAAAGDFERALHHYRLYNEAENALLDEEAARAAAELEARYESAKKEAEIQVLRQEARLQRRLQSVFAVTLVLGMILTVVLSVGIRHKTRANRLLQEKNEEISKQRSKLIALTAVLEDKSQEYFISSIVDRLTETYNKAYILDVLGKSFSLAQRYSSPLACVFVDLDHFKRVNDTYGHVVGDQVLQLVAATVSDQIRNEDSVGRYGGEEFLVILPNTHLDGAMRVAEKIRLVVSELEFTAADPPFRLTVSAGVAEVQAHNAASPEDLLELADAALYAAKNQGRNRSVAADTDRA